jgi:multiple sugar transport system substrate-binding protein
MKLFFAGTLLVLALLSVVAWQISPKTVQDGKTQLVWASDDNPARREQIDLFNKEYPDCNLTLDPNNRGMEKVVVQSIAGVGPDLFDAGAGNLDLLIDSGIAWDVTDELKKNGVDVLATTWQGVQDISTREGRVYGIPSNAAANALLINKTIFDNAGVPYPNKSWTWEEFLPIAQKLTLRDEKGRAKQFGFLMDWWLYPQFIIQWGGRVYTEDGTRCVIDSPEAIAGMQFLHDLMYKYKVMPSPVEEAAMATQGGWGSGTITQFGEGSKIAMALAGRWWLCTLRNKDQFPNLKMTVAEAPHHNKRIFLAYGRATFINAQSPRREQALKFLLYMAGQGYNDLINDQADAVSPFKTFCYTDNFLVNPEFPEEDKNDVWREVIEVSVPNVVSPFVNAQAANRILTKQTDLIKNNQKPVADALRDAAREVNAEIQKTLAKNPELKKRYDALVAKQKEAN